MRCVNAVWFSVTQNVKTLNTCATAILVRICASAPPPYSRSPTAWRPRLSLVAACSSPAIKTRSWSGSPSMKRLASCAHVPPRGAFFPPQDKERASLLEQLHQSPHLWGESRSRWTLQLMSLHLPEVRGLSESGVWRRLQKWRLTRRRTRSHLTSPDPAYRAKVALLERAKVATQAGHIELFYGDEH